MKIYESHNGFLLIQVLQF